MRFVLLFLAIISSCHWPWQCAGLSAPQLDLICTISPLGAGHDDTDQVLSAIEKCGHGGHTILRDGVYNITRKMTWDLVDAKVDLHGFLSFVPDIEFWLNPSNTYRVVFIQSSLVVVITGRDFEVDAHNTGGIQGNGKPWWDFFTTVPRADGDGRPISLTLFRAVRGRHNPFWCNCIAESQSCNASNTNATFFGQKSDDIALLNWDITCGDDCLAIKGVPFEWNSTNFWHETITCRGGSGVAFGSLAQYVNLTDMVENVLMDTMTMTRINASIQPNMGNGVYFKSWDGSVNGAPPTGRRRRGSGFVKNVTLRNVVLDRVDLPTTIEQTKDGHRHSIRKWTGTALTIYLAVFDMSQVVALVCSPAVNCTTIGFEGFDPCQNVVGLSGLSCTLWVVGLGPKL
ncbi:pectin lyase fold/virulence factor [Mycena pura]|uniref:galacturonan 1,4-alpha-galacturonidase n=1 Tax=Mycena pura TaxID=153505 RepID=A0AAD6UNZ4_9AGAR|nr:pectin lyase fold/virulence factor [Mycena pura]